MLTTILLCTTLTAVGLILGYMVGWDEGVEDTERRWREAVGRYHDHVRNG